LHPLAAFNAVDELRREITAGVDINEPDNTGVTPLHSACVHKSYDTAKVLLEAGAEVNVQDQWGITPLGRAVFGKDGTVELVQLLVDHGADPTIENNKGNSALKLAQSTGKAQYLAVFEAAEK
jgi:ankyrin repeat protein